MQLGQALTWTAQRFPNRVGVGGRQPLTYRQWDARTNQFARALAEAGAARGDRVVLLLGNGEPLASLHLAAQKLGVASTPLNTRFGSDELAHCVADADPTVMVTDDGTSGSLASLRERLPQGRVSRFLHMGREVPEGSEPLEPLAAAQPDGVFDVVVGPDDASVLLYTAGTTGRPKGVPRTQRNEWAAALAHVVQCQYSLTGEATLGVMPIFHTMGVRSLLAMVLVGGTWSPVPAIDPDLVGEAIQTDALSCLYLVPTAFFTLLHAGVFEKAPSIRKLAYAGAPMTPTLAEQLTSALNPDVFVNHFGSTEVYTYTVSPDQGNKPGCAGRAGLFSRVRLVRPDPEGRGVSPVDFVAAGERGEVIVSLDSDEAFAGYRNRPEATAEKLRGGWFFTGDLGQRDEDGDLWVAGRVDDMVITGGENVHPVEVEDALARCPDVAEVAVAGVPDDKWGQAVTAFVVPAAVTDPQAGARIEEWVRNESGLTAFKRPKQVVLVPQIPKSPVGKIIRRDLTEGRYDTLSTAGASGTEGASR